MKKLLVFCVCILCVSGIDAQKKVTFGIRAGVNLSTYSTKNDYISQIPSGYGIYYKKSMYPGVHIGLIADIQLSRLFYLQPGIYYTTMGAKYKEDIDILHNSQKSHINGSETQMPQYIQIPVLFSLRIPINVRQDIAWRVNAGPYISCGVAGKVDSEIYVNTQGKAQLIKGKENIFQNGYYRRLDAGFSFGTGFDIRSFYIGFNFDLGLVNIEDYNNIKIDNMTLLTNKEGLKTYNRNISLRLGYNF